MKRINIVFLVFILSAYCIFADTNFQVLKSIDEWGDQTGESYLAMYTDVFTYSNYVFTNEDGMYFALFFYPEIHAICGAAIIYDYNPSIEKYFMDETINVKYRDDLKKVVEVNTKRLYNKEATFTFVGEDAEKFVLTMQNTDKIQLIVTGTKYERNTKYNCTFEYDRQELVSYLDEIDW